MKLPNWITTLSVGKKSAGGTVSLVQFLEQAKGGKTDYYTDWVYAGFIKIAQSLARTEWQLYKANGKTVEEVEDAHPLLGLLYKFNRSTTRFDAMVKTLLGFMVDGEVGWYVSEKTNGKPSQIQIIKKQAYKVATTDEFGNALTYEISTVNAGKKTVQAIDFFVIKNANPNGNDGFSVLNALRDVADTDHYISRWNKKLMQNDATPSGVIELPEGAILSEAEAKAMKKDLQEGLGGYDNAHSLAVLMNGAKLTQTAVNPKDLDFVNGRNFNRDLLLAVIGTPKTLLGLDNGVTKATAETAERIFAKYTLEPILEQVTEWLNEYLVPQFDKTMWLGFEPLAQEDREQKLAEADRGYNRWLTTNEARAMFGFDPINGGDFIYMPLINMPMVGGKAQGEGFVKIQGNPVKRGAIPSHKANYIATRIKNRQGYKMLVGDAVAQKVADKIESKCDHEHTNARKVLKLKSERSDEAKEKAWNNYIEVKRTNEQGLKDVIGNVFERQKQIILANLKKQEGKSIKALTDEVLFDLEEQTKSTVAIIEPQVYQLATEGLKMAGELAGMEALTIEQIPSLQTWVKKISDKYGEDVTVTTYKQLSDILQNGVDEGLGIYDLGNNIEDYFKTIAPYRADMIARTESARAMTSAQGYAWEQYGIKEVEWYLAGSDPCNICQENSTQKWTVEDMKSGVVEYAHPNCECLWL